MQPSAPARFVNQAAHPHRRWGGCADELAYYTSRYYPYTQAMLRVLARQPMFCMAGYQAERLAPDQRALMLGMLSLPPDRPVAGDIIRLVDAARAGRGVPALLAARYRTQCDRLRQGHGAAVCHPCEWSSPPAGLQPLDPFLALAARLGLPVAISGHRVEVPFDQLVPHLDSASPQVRENLHCAVLWLHDAGYRLVNHPHLTHAEGAL